MLRRLAPILVVMLVVLAACKGAPTYSDPTDIITKGLDATAKLKSFHVSLALSGSFTMPGSSGGSFKLDSTSLEADVDIGAKQGHLTFAIPAFLGLSGEVLVIGSDLYVKTNMTGDKWSHSTKDLTGASAPTCAPGTPCASPAPAASGAPYASFNTASMIQEVKDFLAKDGVVTTKLADVACGDRQCYQISVSVPSSLMKDAGAVASMDPSTIFGDALVLNMLFDRDKLWLTELSTDVASDRVGTFSATLSFSHFDEAVTLSPPPDAQVTEGEFTIPGM